MSDSYKEDMKELKGQETTLEQKLKERHRIFQSSGDTRQVRTLAHRLLYICFPLMQKLIRILRFE